MMRPMPARPRATTASRATSSRAAALPEGDGDPVRPLAYLSPLKPPAKASGDIRVILVIALPKRALGGSMALFPMVTTVAACEAR